MRQVLCLLRCQQFRELWTRFLIWAEPSVTIGGEGLPHW